MKTIELSDETGWAVIPGSCKIVVAHYKDGHSKKMSIGEFLLMGKKRNLISRVDCYDSEDIEK